MKDHEIRELVNSLRDIAIKYHSTQSLRERIAHIVRTAVLQADTFREKGNSSTESFREISETATNSPAIPESLIAAINSLLDSDGSRGCYSAIQCGEAHEEIERLLADISVISQCWIPVSERMPGQNQNVLISVNFDSSLVEPLICTARYTGSTFRRGSATVKPGNGVEEATHWMPLPFPPKKAKYYGSRSTFLAAAARNE